jgi:hypothetical protein
MRNSVESMHVKTDYLVRLGPIRYRLDTNFMYFDVF